MNKVEQQSTGQTVAESGDSTEILKRIAGHLVFLEKKIDMLLEAAKSPRPANGGFGNTGFSRPRGNYGHGRPGSYGQHRGYGQAQGGRYPARHSGQSRPSVKHSSHQ